MSIIKRGKLKLLLFFSVLSVILALFLYRKYFPLYYQYPYDSRLVNIFEGGIAKYDIVKRTSSPNSNPFGLKLNQVFERDLTTYQEFKSGQWVKIILPLDFGNKINFLDHDTILQLVSAEKGYSFLLRHPLYLVDSLKYCQVITGPVDNPNYTNRDELTIKNGLAMTLDTFSDEGESRVIIAGCFPDTNKRAWTIQFELPKDLYEKEYKDKIIKIFENFKFAQGKKN